MLQGRCLLCPWPRADVLGVAHPQAPGRGLPHSGHPSELMQQGRDAHPIPGATLNPGWVQEGNGAERRRGAAPEKHHSGLHFVTMATSWKPYRIQAPEHQIREAAVGRMLAPRGWTGSPGALGWGEHGDWWHFSPPCLGADHPACYPPSALSIPSLPAPWHQKKTQIHFCKTTLHVGLAAGQMLRCVGHSRATGKGRRSVFPLYSESYRCRRLARGRRGDAGEKISTKSPSVKWLLLKLAAVQLALHVLVEKA